jgi:hypothetical protein
VLRRTIETAGQACLSAIEVDRAIPAHTEHFTLLPSLHYGFRTTCITGYFGVTDYCEFALEAVSLFAMNTSFVPTQ